MAWERISSMKISRLTLASVLTDMSLSIDPNDFHKWSKEIAAYLLVEKRVTELDSLIRDIIKYRAQKGLIEAIVYSAFPIDNKVKTDLKNQIKNIYPNAQQINLIIRMEPALIGGLRIEVIERYLDLSLKEKINRLRKVSQQTVFNKGVLI